MLERDKNGVQMDLRQTTVLVGVLSMLVYFNSLKYSSFPIPTFLHKHTCLIPVHSVLVFPCMDCYSVLGVIPLHCQLVLHQSFLQAPVSEDSCDISCPPNFSDDSNTESESEGKPDSLTSEVS